MNLSPSGPVFTAPITGKYSFDGNIEIQGYDGSGHNLHSGFFTTSNYLFYYMTFSIGTIVASSTISLPGSLICDMDAGDTAYMSLIIYGSTKTLDVGFYPTRFNMNLIC